MVGIAQLVRALDCGPRGRGFDPLSPPHFFVGGAGSAVSLLTDNLTHISGCSTAVSMRVFQTRDQSSILCTRTTSLVFVAAFWQEIARTRLIFCGATFLGMIAMCFSPQIGTLNIKLDC